MYVVALSFVSLTRSRLSIVAQFHQMITCGGCILTHSSIVIYGLEHSVYLCNIRYWLLCIAFTMVFMPLFMKSYRISLIFTGMLTVKKVSDYRLVLGVGVCLVVDTLILGTFTILKPDGAVLTSGRLYTVHQLLDVQEQYPVCANGWEVGHDERSTISTVFLIVTCLWKGLQLAFGGTVAMIVSRVRLEYMHKYDETTAQAKSILAAILVMVMGSLPVVLNAVHDPTGCYLILGICGTLITNVVLAANFIPRLWAVHKGQESKFRESCDQAVAFESVLKRTLRKRGKRFMVSLWSEVERQQTAEMVRLRKSALMQSRGQSRQSTQSSMYESSREYF